MSKPLLSACIAVLMITPTGSLHARKRPQAASKPPKQTATKVPAFFKSRDQVLDNKHVLTTRLGTFFNRIDGDQASSSTEGYFLSSLSYIIGLDWEYQQSTGWSTLLSVGYRIYRYKQAIEPTLFQKDYTYYHPELWLGMGKRFTAGKPMMLKLYVGNYRDHYYFAPTFDSLAFESDRLIALKTQFDWTAHQWNKNKEIGVEVYAQVMRRGQFLRGGSEFGARILFGLYPIRIKYELSASYMRTSVLKYRMIEGAVLFEYLFGR